MKFRMLIACGLMSFAAILSSTLVTSAEDEAGFKPLFDGKTLDGWTLTNKQGPGYVIEDEVLVCPAEGGGNLFTSEEYSDFVLRFEVKMQAGGNNGVGIRSPLEGDPAYVAMEIQVLDDDAEQYANLQPYQFHGSIYGVVAAKRGSLKPAGEWNEEEIMVNGRHVKITLNGDVIVDANLDDVKDENVLAAHPGLARTSGHIGFLGHGTRVEFRNIRLKNLAE